METVDERPTIIVTAPHAKCTELVQTADKHWCDVSAGPAATRLASNLVARDFEVILFISNTPRQKCDLNRSRCRNEGFRPKLRAALLESDPIVLLDVHSFPKSHRDLDFYVIVDPSPRIPFLSMQTEDMARAMLSFVVDRLPVSVSLFKGRNNDIIDSAINVGVPALLLEFNESLSANVTGALSDVISDWVKTIVE